MTKVFTASNGSEVFLERGELFIGNPPLAPLTMAGVQALREFFQHAHDEELGRWRWPEDPQFVVYGNGDYCTVSNEKGADFREFTRGQDASMVGLGYRSAARAYFAAHPVPKPWSEAEPGEVWILTVDGVEFAGDVDDEYEVRFHQQEVYVSVHSAAITAGRRIYPESSDD